MITSIEIVDLIDLDDCTFLGRSPTSFNIAVSICWTVLMIENKTFLT